MLAFCHMAREARWPRDLASSLCLPCSLAAQSYKGLFLLDLRFLICALKKASLDKVPSAVSELGPLRKAPINLSPPWLAVKRECRTGRDAAQSL